MALMNGFILDYSKLKVKVKLKKISAAEVKPCGG